MPALSIPALDAVERSPHLHAQVAEALAATRQRIQAAAATAIARPDIEHTIDSALATLSGAVIALEGPPGSGRTTLLATLAVHRPSAIWLPGQDAGQGLALLCAQLIAQHNLPVPLVPPAAARDSIAIERILAEAVGQHTADQPLLILIDSLADDLSPRPPPFPQVLPAGVVIISVGGAPTRHALRVTLPESGEPLLGQIAALAIRSGADPEIAALIASRAGGSFLYVRVALAMIAARTLDPSSLPAGLEALLQRWWSELDKLDRQLMALLAAAGEPLALTALAELTGVAPFAVQKRLRPRGAWIEWRSQHAAIVQPAIRQFVAAAIGAGYPAAHATIARWLTATSQGAELRSPYHIRQLSRHIALSDAATRAQLMPQIEGRSWMVAQERQSGSMRAPAADAVWSLWVAAQGGPTISLVRAAFRAGTLALLARSIAPDAPGAALAATIERGGARDLALRRARALIDQLPDGRDKAVTLRRLGEVCYELRMRAPAMRMLSEALDLEQQGLPRSWHDEREEALVALARSAIGNGRPDIALGITTLIHHPERRGMIDTEVVRLLIMGGDLRRAEEVAYAISHPGTHEWAMAEVAVAWARAGDRERADMVMTTLRTATASAWAITELAADAGRAGDPSASQPVLELQSTPLRDRALAQVARALAEGRRLADAHAAASAITDPEIQARAFVGVAEASPAQGEPAMQRAEQLALAITGEERASVLAAVAAAHATAGSLDRALEAADSLPPGEERDRAHARIAVALARRGDSLAAHNVALGIQDDDERAWALDELARQVAHAGRWEEAFDLASQISDQEQRARTEADVAIALARAGDPETAQDHADRIGSASERVRALSVIALPLAAAGAHARIRAAAARTPTADLRSRYLGSAAAALAHTADLRTARFFADQTGRPIDHARALIAITRSAAVAGDRQQATVALADALLAVARLGRSETLVGIATAADALVQLEGSEFLLAVASALDELDSWWA